MSLLLDAVLEQAANGSPATVALSSESVAVLLFASGFLEKRFNWLDKQENLLDEVTDEDWDEIEKLVANLVFEVENPVEVSMSIVGEIRALGHNTIPENWLLCDGTVVSQSAYPELWEAIGNNFLQGGEGAGNFRLPDFRVRSPYGASGGAQPGARLGASVKSLSINEIPAHTHIIPRGNGTTSGTTPRVVQGNQPLFVGIQAVTDAEGGGQSFSLLHPVLTVNFIIYAGEQ